MRGLLADLKHAARLYGRTPLPSLIAVIVLAVGMAFVGAFLSLYVDLLLKPHPGVEESRDIVTIAQVDGARFTGVPIALVERMSNEMSSLDSAVGVFTNGISNSDGDFIIYEGVMPGFFERIRPRLAQGRGLEASDHARDAEPVAVISDRYWREELEAEPDVLGTMIEFPNPRAQSGENEEAENDRLEFRVVGIMAPEMRGFRVDRIAFWTPFESIAPLLLPADAEESMYEQMRRSLMVMSFGRLSDGASASAVVREIESRYPESTEEYQLVAGFRLDAVSGIVRNLSAHRDAERQLNLFLAGSILLALVAAANVSLFLLARAPGRRRELAIRMSVGAPLKRLARQLASEAGLLVIVSAVLGLLMSIWLANFLRGLAFLRQAEWSNVTMLDWRVLSLVCVFLLLLTILVSLAPVLDLKRLGIASASRQVAARASLAQRIAGTAQIAIAGTLGGAAMAFGWHLGSIVLGHPGYEMPNRHYAFFSPNFALLSAEGGGTFRALDDVRLRETIETIPGVSGVSFTTLVPAQQPVVNSRRVPDRDNPGEEITIGYGSIDSAFVDVLGLRLLYGRAPTDAEEGVALVNQSLARLFFGRENVVGEFLDIASRGGPRTEIVGVLEDLSFAHPAADVGPILFTKQAPAPFGTRSVIESPLPTGELEQQLQDLIDSGELELGQPSLQPLSNFRENIIAPDTARSLLTMSTASLVVLLAAFGFYGTQRFLVTAGRREYAIRASLGAGPRALGRLVFARGLLLSLPGLVLGALLAFILVAWLRDDFISRDVPPGTVTIAVVVGLTLLLLAASLGPARQARRTQPAPLLREE